MRFLLSTAVTGAASADPDPRTNPQDVPAARIFSIPPTPPGTDSPPSRLLLALEGTAGNTASVTLWALDEATWNPGQDEPESVAALSARRWYQIGGTIALTVGQVVDLTSEVPTGPVYCRVTVAPAADGIVKIGAL